MAPFSHLTGYIRDCEFNYVQMTFYRIDLRHNTMPVFELFLSQIPASLAYPLS